MRLTITPLKDAAIYSQSFNLNSGLDEILECGTSNDGNYPIRSLLQFDLTQFASASVSASYELTLFVALAQFLNVTQSVEVRNVVAAWGEGSGYAGQDIYQLPDGITWESQPQTGSLSSSASIINLMNELTVDVSNIIRAQLSGQSSGMMLQFPIADEIDPLNRGNIKFFSSNTHTIYAPTLVASWDDQIYVTGSLGSYPSSNLLVIPATLKPQYTLGEIARVELSVRPAIPTKTFSTQFTQYLGNNYLPTSSYYSIIDDFSGKIIVPFDDSSKIQCDGTVSYFIFRVEDMYPRRFYRVKVKVDHDGLSEIFDDGHIFKVID